MVKRLIRLFSSIAAAVSFVLFISTAGFWIVSLHRNDMLSIVVQDTTYLLVQSHGEMLCSNSIDHEDSDPSQSRPAPSVRHMELPKSYDLNSIVWLFIIGDRQSTGAGSHGFGYIKQTDAIPGEQPGWAIIWPHWSLLLLTSLLPLSWLRRWRKQHRRAAPGFPVQTASS
jgi:hypothetical protein